MDVVSEASSEIVVRDRNGEIEIADWGGVEGGWVVGEDGIGVGDEEGDGEGDGVGDGEGMGEGEDGMGGGGGVLGRARECESRCAFVWFVGCDWGGGGRKGEGRAERAQRGRGVLSGDNKLMIYRGETKTRRYGQAPPGSKSSTQRACRWVSYPRITVCENYTLTIYRARRSRQSSSTIQSRRAIKRQLDVRSGREHHTTMSWISAIPGVHGVAE